MFFSSILVFQFYFLHTSQQLLQHRGCPWKISFSCVFPSGFSVFYIFSPEGVGMIAKFYYWAEVLEVCCSAPSALLQSAISQAHQTNTVKLHPGYRRFHCNLVARKQLWSRFDCGCLLALKNKPTGNSIIQLNYLAVTVHDRWPKTKK